MRRLFASDKEGKYVTVSNGETCVQIFENRLDAVSWLVVRDKEIEQRIALNISTMHLLCKAVSMTADFDRINQELDK